ncbi:mucin-like protein [Erpetoichthys calabaricus]|uniref:mucin-like protein n=1 Tax=Erpetoichthys calabaricus TaxID=27687 RepID=UPI0022347BFC|nr:mucin-like protein [Erpetoichthys calabaricus]
MLWGPEQRVHHWATMGYTSGATEFYNDPQTQQNNTFGSKGRYRPHQATGNTGLQGQWIYQLDRINVSGSKDTNDRTKCQQWYLSEPSPSMWTADLIPCPCHSQQAVEDASFSLEILPLLMASQVQALQSLNSDGAVFQSFLPNSQGAGHRCTYDHKGYLLHGSSERYFIYNAEAPVVQDHINKDLLPFDWCCIKSPLCHLYYTKRPADNCSKYFPGGIGLFYGSLHFRTFDGMDYTFTGLGEYVILRLSSSKGTNVFTLQGLTEVVKVDQAPASVTAFMRLAAFYQGKGKVEWRPASNESELLVLLDDEEVSMPSGDGLWQSPQKDFALLHPVDTQSVLVYSSGLQISVDMDSSGHLRAVIKVPQSFYNRTVGLLGQWNGDKMDDFLYSNGKRLSFKDGKIPTEKAIYDFGLSWTVPQPESLIPSDQESSNFQPVFMEELLTSVSADILEQNRNTCRGKIPCLHDFLATGLIDVGMQTIKFLEKSEKMLALFGNMPPSITGPSVIQCKVNFNNTFVFMAVDRNNDTISFSLLLPVPDGAIMNPVTGELTWTPRNANPVVLTVQVNDQLSETVTSPVIQMCNCMNGGTCDYSRIIQNYRKGKFQVVGCLCPQGFSGPLCSNITESCKGRPCFPGIGCTKQPSPQLFSCAKCPPGTVAKDKEGYKCFQQNLCLPPFPFPCHPMAECSSSGYNYTCRCMPGFSGDGLHCTDINECLSPSACPNAKFECINTVGSVQCSCRYQNAQDTETCGDSANPPGWNIFNCTLKWSLTSSSPKDTTKMERTQP